MHPKFNDSLLDAFFGATYIIITKQTQKTFTSDTLLWHRHVCKTKTIQASKLLFECEKYSKIKKMPKTVPYSQYS